MTSILALHDQPKNLRKLFDENRTELADKESSLKVAQAAVARGSVRIIEATVEGLSLLQGLDRVGWHALAVSSLANPRADAVEKLIELGEIHLPMDIRWYFDMASEAIHLGSPTSLLLILRLGQDHLRDTEWQGLYIDAEKTNAEIKASLDKGAEKYWKKAAAA